MNGQEILNFLPDNFLIPVYKFYLYATLTQSGLCRIKINQMTTQETGLDWITFSKSHQVGWIECIRNIPDEKNI